MDIDTNTPPSEAQRSYARFLADAANRPFAWGSWDCATFAAAAVEALTGTNHLAGLSWTDESDARRLLSELGGLRAAVTARLGEPGPALVARAGDVVLARSGPLEMLSICHGPHLIAPGSDGLVVLPLDAGICCWRVA